MDGTHEAELAMLQSQLGDLKKELAEARKQNKAIARELINLAKVTPPPRTPVARKPAGGYLRVIIGDTHGAHIDRKAWAACRKDLEGLDVKEVILLGDHIECSGWIAEHQPSTTISQTAYTYAEALAAANQWLDELQETCPNAQYHMLQGNHCHRVEKWIVSHTMAREQDHRLLLEALDPEFRLNLKDRKIKFYRRDEFNSTCPERGMLRIGTCRFVHEVSVAKQAAAVALQRYGCSVVFGHSHRADISYSRNPGTGLIVAANPGCLCKLAPIWKFTDPTGWSHGYSIQVVSPDETFLHVNVQIVDGKSQLGPMKLSRKKRGE